MAQQHEMTRLAELARQEARDLAKKLGPQLLGPTGGPDAEKQTEPESIAYIQRNWPDPQFRQAFYARAVPLGPPTPEFPQGVPSEEGLKQFHAAIKAAFPGGYTPPPPPSSLDALVTGGQPAAPESPQPAPAMPVEQPQPGVA